MNENNKYLLLIDDDEDDRLLFKLALQEAAPFVQCHTAQDDEEVYSLMSEGKQLPDIIFLDLNMPVKSGWDFLQEFKDDERLRNIPVIIYSTSSSPRDIERARELRALCFLVKPDDFGELKKFLSAIAGRELKELCEQLKKSSSTTCHVLMD